MRRSLLTFVFAILATAAAQAQLQTFTSQQMGFSIALPSDWVTQASPDETYLNVQPAAGTAQSGRVAIEVFVEPTWTGSLDQGVDEVLADLRAALMPDLRVEARSEVTISGLPARVIDIRGTAQMTHDVTYRTVFVLHGRRGYVLFLEALSDHAADYRSLFDQVLASFTLTDVPTALSLDPDPCNPLVPGSCSGSQPPGGGSAALEASFSHSGVVGQLAPDGLAAGQLAGEAGAVAYHTYVIDVPAGIARLTIELDADIDLDLAIKHGSEILSYAPRAQGGDWDYLDASEANPSIIVIERPPAGTWYIDVINALGAGRVGSYYLAVQTSYGVGSLAPDPLPRGSATEVPDPCLLLPLVPAGATASAPPLIAAGTRLVYYTAAASIPGERGQLVQDDYGSWIDRETGQRYDERHIPGAGGEGFEVVQVGYLDERLVQLTRRSYLIDGTTGRTMYMSEAGVVSHAGCAGDFWIHPQVLAALPDMDQVGTRVLRMPYRLGELVFDAIRIHTTSAAGFNAYVYDLDSGLLLYFGSRTVGPDILTPYPGGESGPGRGSTQLANGWIRDIQHVDVPWRDAPTPDWVAQVRELDYEGTLTVVVPGSPSFPMPVRQHVQAGHRGRDWLQVRTEAVMSSFEQFPMQYVTSHGPASIGGLWIAPQALARLRQGQLIDRCEIVGYTTTVAATSADVVTLSEAGPLHRNAFTYDTRTGLLVAVTRVQQLGDTQHVLELRLVAGPR